MAPAPLTTDPATNPEKKRKPGRSLIVGGIVSFGVGYLLSILAGGILAGVNAGQSGLNGGASCFNDAPWFFAPLIGGIGAAASYPHYGVIGTNGKRVKCGDGASAVTAFGVIDSLTQFAGAGMIGAGIGINATDHSSPARAARFLVLPGAPSAPLGATLALTWF